MLLEFASPPPPTANSLFTLLVFLLFLWQIEALSTLGGGGGEPISTDRKKHGIFLAYY
jgi:hypothetical protein